MDLYNIPGDCGGDWRLNKYCEYQSTVPPINPITYTAFARRNKLSKDECVYLAWLNSTCYSAETAIFMFICLPLHKVNKLTCGDFWDEFKDKLVFISARQYAKNMDWFVPLIKQFLKTFGRHPYKKLKSLCSMTPRQNYQYLFKKINYMRYMGRFSTDLFMEALVHMSHEGLLNLELEYPEFTWKQGSNITSGIMNIFYRDEAANEFDKTKKLTDKQKRWLDGKLRIIQDRITELYPEQNNDIAEITPKLCSFRNLFKGTRYGGYHHDRQLEIILRYKDTLPQFNKIWEELLQIRKEQFNQDLLGELNGWSGVRKERKKLFLEKGLTGIEKISR